jgi:hypothetical protein
MKRNCVSLHYPMGCAVNRKAFVSAVLLVVFGATHQAENSTPQAPGKQSQTRSGTPGAHADEAELCKALVSSLSGGASTPSGASSGRCFAQDQDILFIVATAPNPANSQLALSFDRTVDAIQRAVGDRGFLFDRFVFPWDAEPQYPQPDSDKHRGEENRRRESETRPGMLLFRYEKDSRLPYERLAVLLVPENPTSGVNDQAFQAAAMFAHGNSKRKEQVLVLGPSFSSSAASLRAAMNRTKISYLIRTGSATVSSAWTQLSNAPSDGDGQPVFQATVRNDDEARKALFQHLETTGEWRNEWQKEGRIATLSESGTLFGSDAAAQGKDKDAAPGGGTDEKADPNSADAFGRLNLVFPRGISWLRNAYQDMPSPVPAAPTGLPSPIARLLPLAISEATQGDDKPPSLSGTQTPISEEAALLNIATTLRRERVRFVVITGTDPLDNIFLMRFLRTHCPDLRLITFEADLLYVRAAAEFPATGVILVTTYPLFTRNQYWTKPKSRRVDDRVPFVSMASEGTYNACRSLLVAAANGHITDDDILLDYRDPFHLTLQKPPVWLTVTTPNGYWPLALLSDPDLSKTQVSKSPGHDEHDLSELLLKWPAQTEEEQTGQPLAEDVSRLWYLIAILLVAACATPLIALTSRVEGGNATLFRLFAPKQELDAESSGRAFFRSVLTLCLAMLAIVVAWPALALWQDGTNKETLAIAFLLMAVAAALVVASGIRELPRIATSKAPTSRDYAYMMTGALLMFAASIEGWRRVFHGGHHHEGFFAAYRSLDLVNGVAPNVPFVFLVLVILCWAWTHLKRLDRFASSCHTVPQLDGKILDRSHVKLDEARKGVNRGLSLPFSYPPLSYIAAIVGLTAFYFGMSEYTQSLELCAFDVLYGGIFPVVVMMLVLTGARLLVIWIRFRSMLRILELHPIRQTFGKIQLAGSWGPILHRSLGEEELEAREQEVLRRIKGSPEHFTDATAELLRERLLDPQWETGVGAGPDFEAAAEFYALRYVRFIQVVCRQMENLLIFITVGFVLTLISLNSYPFQSGHVLGWFMANLLIVLGAGIGIVLAGTERDPILSRINGTTPGKIGKDFYLNVLSYGALPLLTVLAAQFPSVGKLLFSWVQPMLQALRG